MPAGKPKYTLIADQLMREIETGHYPVGSLLPTESALMLAYGVSRHTVRSAVQDLRTRGVVSSRQGMGSVVTEPGGRPAFVETIQSVDALIAYGQDTRRELIGSRTIEADEVLAGWFDCRPGRLLAEAQMRRTTVGSERHTIAVVTLWIDAVLEPVIESLNRLQKSAAEIIRERFGYETRSVVQTVEAGALETESAAVLGAEDGDPALIVRRAYSTSAQSAPFLIARSVSKAGTVQVVSTFTGPVRN